MLLCDKSFFIAFHREGNAVRSRDRVDTISIAIEIKFQNFLRIEVADVRTESRGIFVFRSIHEDAGSGIRSGLNGEMIDAVRAGHRAAEPASIGHALGKA